MNVNYHKLTET